LGNETNVRQIQEFIDKRKAHLAADEIAKDDSLKEAEKVIEQLKHKRK